MSGVVRGWLSLPSPAITCPGEVGGINCGGDMGVRRCLARSLTSLALMRTPKSANGPRSNSFRPDSPLTTPSNRGWKTQPYPSPHRTWSVPDASSILNQKSILSITHNIYQEHGSRRSYTFHSDCRFHRRILH